MTSNTSEPTTTAPRVSVKQRVAEGFSRAGKGLDQSLTRAGAVGPLAVWPVLYALAIGLFVWALGQEEAGLKQLGLNKVAFDEQLSILTSSAAAGGALAVLYGAVMVVERLRRGVFNPLRTIGSLNRWLVGLLALPFVAALTEKGIESSDGIWTALLGAAAASFVALSAYAVPRLELGESRGIKAPPRAIRVGLVVAAVAALWLVYGYLLSRFALTNHHALNTRTIDLGYYDQVFYHSLHGRPLGCNFIRGGTHASAHFDPILILLSPLYLIRPNAELLLVLQSFWLGSGVVPAYLLARAKLKSHAAGLVLAAAYFFYPALHGANMYEFHSLTLIAPLVLWLLYFFERQWFKRYAAMLVLLTLCREDVPLLLCFVGLYAIRSGRPRDARIGALTIAYCVAYFLVVRNFFMPASGVLNTGSREAYSYEYYFRDLIPHGRGALGLLVTLFTNPVFVLEHAFADPKKILYLLQIFVPLGLLPFFARRARIMLLYGLLVTLLASREPVFDISFQYSCLLFPFAFALTPLALRQLSEDARLASLGLDPRRFVRAALAFVLVATVLLSWKFGVFVENTAFRGGFGRIARPPLSGTTLERWNAVKSMVEKIPPGAGVLTTNRVGAFVSNRKDVYFYHQRKQTHYVFVDEREIKERYRDWHNARKQSGELVEIDRYGDLALFQVDPSRVKETQALQKQQPKPATRPAPRRPRAPLRDRSPEREPEPELEPPE